MTSPRSGRVSNLQIAGSAAGRLVMLLVVVVVSGGVVGLAVALPVANLPIDVSSAVQLDHPSLVGTFDPSAALVAEDDLPEGWTRASETLLQYSFVGAEICGIEVKVPSVGEPLREVWADPQQRGFLLSEVIKVGAPKDASTYISELSQTFNACKDKFYRKGQNGERTLVQVRPGQPNPPVDQYVSRTLQAPTGSVTQTVVFFQVGDVIVALQYAGSTKASRKLLDDVQLGILERVAPKQFSRRRSVPGDRPLPPEPTTTTSTTTTLPPTTSSSTSTTVKRRAASTTVKRRTTTTAAPPPAPAPAPPAGQ